MSLYPKFRDVHLWIGLILLLPLGAIAATGVMLNHEKTLGLKPQYEKKEKPAKDKPEKKTKGADQAAATSLLTKPSDWQQHAKQFDFALAEGEKIWGEAKLERMELKNEPGYGLVVKLKVQRDMQTGYSGPEEIVWSVAEQAIIERKGDPKNGIAWNKVVHDLHTGAIFSKEYGFFWSDVSGIAILLLSFTGVVLYAIPLLKKAGKKKQAAAKGSTSPALNPALLAKKARAKATPEAAPAPVPEPAAELTLS